MSQQPALLCECPPSFQFNPLHLARIKVSLSTNDYNIANNSYGHVECTPGYEAAEKRRRDGIDRDNRLQHLGEALAAHGLCV